MCLPKVKCTYIHEDGQLIDIRTGEIINKNDIKQALQREIYLKTHDNMAEAVELGIDIGIKLVKDKKGNDYHSINIKEGYHFVKVFKVDMRYTLESCNLSIFSRGFLYSCLAYLHFPTNTLVMDGESPTNEMICERFNIGKTKLYEVYKELDKIDINKRKKINGQLVIYLNPFLHSVGLVDVETYKLFKDSPYNPINRGVSE